MKTLLHALLWIVPIAIIISSTSACGDNCRNLTVLELESGTWVSSSSMSDPPDSDALHATGTQKRVTVDLDASEVTIAYEDADGREISEVWAMGEIYVD